MPLKGFRSYLNLLSFVSILGLSASTAHAASPCKGLEESVCIQSQSCSWVSGYTTKSGKTVAAYCRSVGKKVEQGLRQKEGKGTQSGANDRTQPSARTKTVSMLEEKNG